MDAPEQTAVGEVAALGTNLARDDTSGRASAGCSPPPSTPPDHSSPIQRLMERTGCGIVQQNGQRRYGPPLDWEGGSPQRGCEIFVGKIPRDCFEDELVPVFERAGRIYEMRLMMDFSGQNRGYAFVVYCSPPEARDAVKRLNNHEIRKGRTLGVCMSVDNCRLFVGGIPKKMTKEDIRQEMHKVTDGVTDVIVYPSASDKTKNRGFAFVEYDSHRAAAMARRKLMNGRVQLWGHHIAIDWAEPELEVDDEIMAQVKVLYVRNLMLTTTEAQIEEAFGKFSPVERVKKIRDYAFVHFHSKDDAHTAMEALNSALLDGAQIEVTLAKPVDKDTYMRSPKHKQTFTPVPYGFVPVDQFGAVVPTTFYSGYYSPPKYMVRNSMGACTMMRVGRSTRGGVGGGGGGGRGGGGRGYFPVSTFSSPRGFLFPGSPVRPAFFPSPPFYDVNKRSPLPEEPVPSGLVEVPSPAPTLALKPSKSPLHVLEEVCQRNGWGQPLFALHSAHDGSEEQVYLYKVTIASLGMTFIPNKACFSVEEAKIKAAENALIHLGLPMEASPYSPVRCLAESPSYQAGYVTMPTGHKPAAWAPAEATPTLYAPTYPEGAFPGSPAYPPAQELFQAGF